MLRTSLHLVRLHFSDGNPRCQPVRQSADTAFALPSLEVRPLRGIRWGALAMPGYSSGGGPSRRP